MKKIFIGASVMLLALAACSKPGGANEQQTGNQPAGNGEQEQQANEGGQMSPAEKAAQGASNASDDAPYYTKLPLKEFMPHVMQYAGDGVWKRQGYINDRTGEHSLFPKNDQEWEDAESAARTLAEVTNVLLIPGRRVPDPEWDKAVIAVRELALKAAVAAEKKDAKAWFEIGGELDEACDVCHVRFDPSFKGKPGPS